MSQRDVSALITIHYIHQDVRAAHNAAAHLFDAVEGSCFAKHADKFCAVQAALDLANQLLNEIRQAENAL